MYQEFIFWETEFQSLLTILWERDEFHDFYFEVLGALVCGLGKMYSNCVMLDLVYVSIACMSRCVLWAFQGFVCINIVPLEVL